MRSAGLILLAALTAPICAQRLALRAYNAADGLPSDYVQRIVPDSRGFLWFCTRNGLSRFDGSRFVTYSIEHGLPIPHVNHIVGARDGTYWVATNGGGICRFEPGRGRGGPLFRTMQVGEDPLSSRVNVLHLDTRGALWAGTDGGLYRMRQSEGGGAFEHIPLRPERESPVVALAEDDAGNVWAGSYSGLVGIDARGHAIAPPFSHSGTVLALLFDREKRLWAGFEDAGLMVARPDGTRSVYTTRDGITSNRVAGIRQTEDGHIWVAGDGLAEFDGSSFRAYSKDNGIGVVRRGGLSQDPAGNLWLSTIAGVLKLARHGFASFAAADGLAVSRIHAIYEERTGALITAGVGADALVSLFRYDGRQFQAIPAPMPADAKAPWPCKGALLDRSGELWVLTRKGLRRYASIPPAGGLGNAAAVYGRREGLTGDSVIQAYEDRRGDLWIATEDGQSNGVTRWDRATGRFQQFSTADGLPPMPNTPRAFAEDAAGALWVGYDFGALARLNGARFDLFTADSGWVNYSVTALHTDANGRLWIATSQAGIARIDDPAAAHPRFVRFTAGEGLASNNVRCLTEDRWGRVYAGTAHGVDRIDPPTGRIRHYTSADGLAGDFVTSAYRDASGALWFGTYNGLSRLEPRPDAPEPPPASWIGGVRIAGVSYPVSEIGERRIERLELDARTNNLEIEFFSLGFRSGVSPRYQFRLDGADSEWGVPGEQRRVQYARLSAGSYRFRVRAIGADGAAGEPAEMSFVILPPLWQRWWFVSAAGLAGLCMLYGLHRFRMARLIEVEQLRRRIAADLHDDIGASLSRVAILTEVVKQQVGPSHPEPARRLGQIADTARGLVDSMSDIVWSVDPRRDDLGNVAMRVRQFADDVFAGCPIAWEFHAPERLEKIKLDPEQRRHLYLIFKEALTNIVRHAGARWVKLGVWLEGGRIHAEIRDDGVGFAPFARSSGLGGVAPFAGSSGLGGVGPFVGSGGPGGVAPEAGHGHGLENMRMRAAQIGGELTVDSALGKGTRIALSVPVRRMAP